MKSIGGLMVLLGAGSLAYSAMGRELAVLAWINTWGPTVGMGIKIGFVVVGVILWFVGHSMGSKATPAQQSSQQPAQQSTQQPTQHSSQTSGDTFGQQPSQHSSLTSGDRFGE